jgi:hypothetical protein
MFYVNLVNGTKKFTNFIRFKNLENKQLKDKNIPPIFNAEESYRKQI